MDKQFHSFKMWDENTYSHSSLGMGWISDFISNFTEHVKQSYISKVLCFKTENKIAFGMK